MRKRYASLIVSVAIIAVTLWEAGRAMSGPISFQAGLPTEPTASMFPFTVDCQPLYSADSFGPIDLLGLDQRYSESVNRPYEGLTREQILQHYGMYIGETPVNNPAYLRTSEWEVVAEVEQSTGFYCNQLRQERQATVTYVLGIGLLLLVGVGVVTGARVPQRGSSQRDD